MLTTDLQEKILLYLKSVEIEVGGYVEVCTLGIRKSSEMASGVIKILKEAAGEPYQAGETEEYTFGSKGNLIVLEEKNETDTNRP